MKAESIEGLEEVAVIGLSCRFPEADNIERLWRNLCRGRESISFFNDEQLLASGVSPEQFQRPNYVRAKGVIDDVEWFDASFFGYTPQEAAVMDPQHRVFLECCWEALESAGYDFGEEGGRVGVYAGAALSSYLFSNVAASPAAVESVGGLQVRIGNDKDFLTTHVSFKLNLQGPSVAVQTACSTSLVAVHLACQALLDGECDLAIAGGAALSFPHRVGYLYREGGIWSPDGHCRAFDEKAAGTVEGNGAGAVVLKRLSEALTDGDFVYAVVKASAVNNDGSLKVGYAAPSLESQKQVVAECLALADVHPETVTLIEAHGSGTALGDPIEVEALTQAFRVHTQKKGYCALGSIKTNLGHLDNAAGVASFIKAVLALQRRRLPPSLHFEVPNPQMDLENSPFFINTRLREWEAESPRRAGVSSLAIGGTNAHVILEEAPPIRPGGPSRQWQLLMLSAKTSTALETATRNLAEHLKERPEQRLADVAHTLQVGRRRFRHRRFLICREEEPAAEMLEQRDPARVLTRECERRGRSVAFLFSGLGDHYPMMSAGLYRSEPVFRREVDACAERLKPLLNLDIRDVLYPELSDDPREGVFSLRARLDLRSLLSDENSLELGRLAQTYLAHPAVFVVEFALARLLMSWGARPHAMIGYSLGEYAAACVSGVFSLEDGLFLVAERARMIQELPGGGLLAVPLSEAQLEPHLTGDTEVAAANGPHLSVIGGTYEAIAELHDRLQEAGVACRKLRTSHAFHTSMLEPLAKRLEKQAKGIALNPPEVPFVSNVTGDWISDTQAVDPAYWSQHLHRKVRFSEGLELLVKDAGRALIEIGPGDALAALARQHPSRSADQPVVATIPDRRLAVSDNAYLQSALGQLWQFGVDLDWRGFYGEQKRLRVPLPAYPFERQRHWIDPAATPLSRKASSGSAKAALEEWFFEPTWIRSDRPRRTNSSLRTLILEDAAGFGAELAERLRRSGGKTVRVRAGRGFQFSADGVSTIRPGLPADYRALLKAVRREGALPDRILHLWSLTDEASHWDAFSSLLYLAQAYGEENVRDPACISVVSNRLWEVTGGERTTPEKAILWGPCRIIPQEYPQLQCQLIDVAADAAGERRNWLFDQLETELARPSSDRCLAFRPPHRWVRTYSRAALEDGVGIEIRGDGAYLVVGGTEPPGLSIAEDLARRPGVKLALAAPVDFPDRSKWESYLAARDRSDPASRRLRRLMKLEAGGSNLLVAPADLDDPSAVKRSIAMALERFGPLNGIVYAPPMAPGGLIQLKTGLETQLRSRIETARALGDVSASQGLDFLAFFSTTAVAAGGLGQVDSCALGAYQESLARDAGICCIHWSPFEWEQWDVPAAAMTSGLQQQLQRTLRRFGLTENETRDSFRRVLRAGRSRIFVCPRDLGAVIEENDTLTSSAFLDAMTGGQTAQNRPDLPVPFAAPSTAVEESVAKLWRESFGIERIGVDDNFFDLAGNSLLAVQIVTRLREKFDVDLPMTALFESPTVAELARAIESIQTGVEGDDWEGLLLQVEGLSVEEVQSELEREKDR